MVIWSKNYFVISFVVEKPENFILKDLPTCAMYCMCMCRMNEYCRAQYLGILTLHQSFLMTLNYIVTPCFLEVIVINNNNGFEGEQEVE